MGAKAQSLMENKMATNAINEQATFDLASFDAGVVQENVVNIVHPSTGAPLGITIKVISPDSEKYRKLSNRTRNRSINAVKKGKNSLTAEMMDENAMELLVGSVLSWEGVTWAGQVMECNEVNVRSVFTKFPWIKEQVDEFLGDRANFIKG